MTMRALYYLTILALPLAGCGPDIAVEPGIIQWMEWPAEVRANTPFSVRLVIAEPGDCGQQSIYRPRVFADQSAVTFSPYFIVERPREPCPAVLRAFYPPTGMIVIGALETVATAPRLRASFARVFDMRGASSVCTISTGRTCWRTRRTPQDSEAPSCSGSFTSRPGRSAGRAVASFTSSRGIDLC